MSSMIGYQAGEGDVRTDPAVYLAGLTDPPVPLHSVDELVTGAAEALQLATKQITKTKL